MFQFLALHLGSTQCQQKRVWHTLDKRGHLGVHLFSKKETQLHLDSLILHGAAENSIPVTKIDEIGIISKRSRSINQSEVLSAIEERKHQEISTKPRFCPIEERQDRKKSINTAFLSSVEDRQMMYSTTANSMRRKSTKTIPIRKL